MNTKKNLMYLLLLGVLLGTFMITNLAMTATNRPYLQMYLASENNIDERATIPLNLIEVDLKRWNSKEQLLPSVYQEMFNLTSDGQDFGYFEGMSYDRYIGPSLLWVKLEWSVSYNDSYATAFVVLVDIGSIEGTKILELNGCSWVLGWLWQNDYSDLRPQDDYLYIIQAFGIILIAGIMTILVTSYLANQIVRSSLNR